MSDAKQSPALPPEQLALHGSLTRTYKLIRKGVVGCDWDAVDEGFRNFCGHHTDLIPQWFVDEYVFQAMRLWAEGQLDEVLRHFANFVNRAAGQDLIDAVAERALLRTALDSPFEKPAGG